MKYFLALCFLGVGLFSYSSNASRVKVARKHIHSLDQAIDYIERYYFFKDSFNLKSNLANIRAQYLKAPGGNGLNYIKLINSYFRSKEDGHSYIYKADTAYFNYVKVTGEATEEFATGHIVDSFAYIKIPGYSALTNNEGRQYVDSLQRIIMRLSVQQPVGWIIDVRENIGGNGQLMLTGLGPLLGDGLFGYFVSNKSERTKLFYQSGKLKFDRSVIYNSNNNFHVIDPHVVVLTGKKTASSGEWVAVAFKGKLNAKSIGQPTHGSSTSPIPFYLKDGATLYIATVAFADRDGNVYGRKVKPDIEVPETENTFDAALKWLRGK